jgi:hypothetical protein
MSRDIINLLIERGSTPAEIAKTLGATKSFVSRVKSGSRSLTLEHLHALEVEHGEPMPWLLMDAIPLSSVPKELRPLYHATKKLLKPTQRRARRKKAAA